MSLDIYLRAVRMTTLYSSNYTSNVIPMWHKAGVYEALYKSEGQKAESVIPVLHAGIKDMEEKPDEYILLNPKNGWGDYHSALEFLKEFTRACEENPDAEIGVWA